MGTDGLDTLYAITEQQVRKMLFGKVYDRAEAYYRSGRVSRPRTVGASLLADVQGTQLYTPSVKVEDGLLVTSCTCPFADTAPCKHVGALLLQWVRDRDSFAICGDEQDSIATTAQATPVPPRYEPLDAVPGSLAGGDADSLAGDDSSDADSDEGQSGLLTLLEPLPFTELRDIARQRGWRVKSVTKADYVTELASSLCDPTETARAVTALPDNLRQALRAAFVADDGSGITATTMAQAMTALRGAPAQPTPATEQGAAAGPTVKPVEAAGLLSDLARWGLVLPWRDSLYNNGSYVLPWEVQRLVPPLPGWCPPSPQAAAAPTQFRDTRQVVNSLYAVWESIADNEPALRPPPEGLDERPLQSMLQGWPYDPRELQGRAGKRGRAQTAVQAFSVPPAPFLVEDAFLPALARSTGGDGDPQPRHLLGEKLEFLCRVLRELDLVSVQNGHLIAQREAMADLLRRPVPEQHRAVGQAYLSLMDWSEMDALLRQDSRLVLWRKPYFPVPYDHFRSSLVRLRHLLLRFLACSGEAGTPPRVSGEDWCRVTDIEAALRELWPRFPAAMQSERQSWISQAWGLVLRPAEAGLLLRPADAGLASRQAGTPSPDAWRDSGTPPLGLRPPGRTASRFGEGPGPDPAKEPDWGSSQGALLRLMLEGPLYWLGFSELSYGDGASLAAGRGQLVAVRFHGLANWIWDRPTAALGEMQPGEAVTIDEATGTLSMPPAAVPPQAHTFLGRIAHLEEASPERFVYRLFQRAAYATFESGISLSDLLLEWERVMPQPIPPALQDILSQWWTRYGQVRLYEGFGLLELCDEVTLRELEAGTSLTQHIVARLSPRLVLVPDEAVEALMREFAAKGYTPKEVE